MYFKILFFLCLSLGLAANTQAGMSSANYQVTSSVLAGGGESMSSGGYQATATMAQPSPLEVSEYASSPSYHIYPGFWHTVSIVILEWCEGDFDGDGDVDGSDLATFAADFGRTDCGEAQACAGDFDGDSDVDGSDLAVFSKDFGRSECPQSTP
jgi:hypothetical protein